MRKRHIFGPDLAKGLESGNWQRTQMGRLRQPVLAKRYAGRRLYGPATGAYLTRNDLMIMAKNSVKVVVIDADTGDDVTTSYHPIIVTQSS